LAQVKIKEARALDSASLIGLEIALVNSAKKPLKERSGLLTASFYRASFSENIINFSILPFSFKAI